jgi:HK97 family phage major capsid protein
VPGLTSGAPDTIFSYPYVVNQSMPQVAAAANTILFGDFSKFVMRRVKDLAIMRLDERFADYGEVAFVAFSRIDSNLVDAGVHPIGYLQMHS